MVKLSKIFALSFLVLTLAILFSVITIPATANAAILCTSNTDCGMDSLTGNPFCQSNDVYTNQLTYYCNLPGTEESYCSSGLVPQLTTACGSNRACNNGSCANASIVCGSSADCGFNALSGNPFCQGNSIYKNFITYSCNSPGTTQSFCSSALTPQLTQACSTTQTCSNGLCVDQNITCNSNSQCGHDGPVGTAFCQGVDIYRNFVTYTCSNPGTTSSVCSNSTVAQLQSTCTGSQICSNGMCSSTACNSDAQCGANGPTGNPFCQSNNVYQNYTAYTCNNPGTQSSSCSHTSVAQLLNTCSGTQSCSNGSCSAVACTDNSQCGTTGLSGSPFCQGDRVYRNYVTYTCNNPGTANSSCTNSTVAKLQDVCVGQTCINGSCNTIISCTSNYQQKCVGSGLYWYDSCGAQQSLIQTCPNGCSGNSCQTYTQNYNYNYNSNSCGYHSYVSCLGNYLYWYDTCGNQQDMMQFCPNGCSGNSCSNNSVTALSVTETVKNLTSGSGFASSVNANPSDMLMYLITLQATGNQNAQNVVVREILPANLIYNNQLVVACTGSTNCNSNYNNSGNIISGVNLGTVYAGQTVTISYQAQVASNTNFSYGVTTLADSVSTTSSNSTYLPSTSASAIITKAGVLGASTVSTGLTNNFWMDSFILPLIITLIGIWLWRAGIFFGIEQWLEGKKKNRRSHLAKKELYSRILEIKKAGRI